MFYDKYKELCEKANISPSRAAIEIGLEKSLVPKWKQRGLTPRAETLNKIADYFNVSVDYLLTGEEKTATPKSDGSSAEFNDLFSRLPKSYQQVVVDLIKSLLDNQ